MSNYKEMREEINIFLADLEVTACFICYTSTIEWKRIKVPKKLQEICLVSLMEWWADIVNSQSEKTGKEFHFKICCYEDDTYVAIRLAYLLPDPDFPDEVDDSLLEILCGPDDSSDSDSDSDGTDSDSTIDEAR